MEPVRQLHHQHPHVLAHGHQELPDVLGVEQVAVREGQLAHLGEAVHDLGDLLPELLAHLLLGQEGVLHGVMEHPAGHAHRVQPPVREVVGHRQGMEEVGFPADAHLGAVAFLPHREGPVEQAQGPVGMMGQEGLLDLVEGPFQGLAGARAASHPLPLAEDESGWTRYLSHPLSVGQDVPYFQVLAASG